MKFRRLAGITHVESRRAGMSKRGFTLVELLVVIAIIALLVSILLPALSRAREQARLVKCMNGARQVFLAIDMYCNDSKGYYPYGFTSSDIYPFGTGPNDKLWHAQLVDLKYLSPWTQTNRGGCPHGPDTFLAHGGVGGEYYTPPSTPAVSYGMNPYLQSGARLPPSSGWVFTRWQRSAHLIRRRGAQVGVVWCSHIPWTFASLDTTLYTAPRQCLGYPDGYLYGGPTQPSPSPYRHQGKGLPVACADGHVEVMPLVEFTVYPPQAKLASGILYYSLWGTVFGAE